MLDIYVLTIVVCLRSVDCYHYIVTFFVSCDSFWLNIFLGNVILTLLCFSCHFYGVYFSILSDYIWFQTVYIFKATISFLQLVEFCLIFKKNTEWPHMMNEKFNIYIECKNVPLTTCYFLIILQRFFKNLFFLLVFCFVISFFIVVCLLTLSFRHFPLFSRSYCDAYKNILEL